jgi:hypothetical protein
MRRTCTPGERELWWHNLAPLSRARRVAVIRMLSEVVSDCHHCDGPVRRSDSRGIVRDRLVHLRCAPHTELTPGQREVVGS